MGKITSIVFGCTPILFLLSCCSISPSTLSTLSRQAGLTPDMAVAASLAETTLPPAYLVTPIKVLQAEKYTEGVVFDREGNLYFSQTKAGTITVLAADGSRRIWSQVKGANVQKENTVLNVPVMIVPLAS